MNLTPSICVIFRGLNFESNEESGKKSRFRTDTKYPGDRHKEHAGQSLESADYA
jgi:hypothetical protein